MKMNTEKISTYQQAVHTVLGKSKQRISNLINEAWISSDIDEESKVLSLDEVIKLTSTNKNYFLKILQMMVDILKLQYNRNYVEDFGEPRSVTYVFEYNSNLQEIILYVSLKIKGVSNKFLYQTSTTFRLTDQNKIVKTIGDEFLYMIALIGNKTQLHSKDSIKEVLNTLSSSKQTQVKQLYNETEPHGPATGDAELQIQSNDNTIRL